MLVGCGPVPSVSALALAARQPAHGLSAAPCILAHLPDLTCSCLQPLQVP